MSTSIRTASGITFDLLRPLPEHVRIADIAHSLARLPRYTGHAHAGFHCSVAEHSVRVCRLAMKAFPKEVPLWWAALMHDAHEAYVGDVSSPLKRAMRAHAYGTQQYGIGITMGSVVSSLEEMLAHRCHFDDVEDGVWTAVQFALHIETGSSLAKARRREERIHQLDRVDLERESNVCIDEEIKYADRPAHLRGLFQPVRCLSIFAAQREFLSLSIACAPTTELRAEAEAALAACVTRFLEPTRFPEAHVPPVLVALADAIKAIDEVIAAHGMKLDVATLMERCSIPVMSRSEAPTGSAK